MNLGPFLQGTLNRSWAEASIRWRWFVREFGRLIVASTYRKKKEG